MSGEEVRKYVDQLIREGAFSDVQRVQYLVMAEMLVASERSTAAIQRVATALEKLAETKAVG
jgi:hypothetical protein